MSRVEILRTGLVTGVGLDAAASCAAIRAGIAGFQETRYRFDGGWLLGCPVPLSDPVRGADRLTAMAAMAVSECLGELVYERAARIPLLLSVAEVDRPGQTELDLGESAIPALERELGVQFHPWSRVFPTGRLGGVQALDYARRVLTEVDLCIVAGVDSLLVSGALKGLHRQHRLLTAANSNGFIPGEGAAALLVGREGSGGSIGCVGVGYGSEPAPRGSGAPLRADGLVQAFQAALADGGWDLGEADFRIADVSGDQFGFKEAALAMTRELRIRKEEFDLWHPSDCVGELGAAIAPLLVAVFDAATREGWAPGPRVIGHVADDGDGRAAFLLQHLEREA